MAAGIAHHRNIASNIPRAMSMTMPLIVVQCGLPVKIERKANA
jgi:hypothetical protein